MAATQALEGYIIDDRYTVCKRLQSGFYGATWLATDARNDYKDVCLKVPPSMGYIISLIAVH